MVKLGPLNLLCKSITQENDIILPTGAWIQSYVTLSALWLQKTAKVAYKILSFPMTASDSSTLFTFFKSLKTRNFLLTLMMHDLFAMAQFLVKIHLQHLYYMLTYTNIKKR